MRYGPLRAVVHRLLSIGLVAFALGGAAPPKPSVLVWGFGDSLTAGYGLAPAVGFTAQLQGVMRGVGIPAEVRNGGVAGDTAAQGRARLLWGLRGLGRQPDLVIVELGANDMLRGLPPVQTARNLDLILAELQRRHIRVLLAGMRAAPNLGPAYRAEFDGIYPALAKRYHVPLYPFFLDGVAGQRRLIQADGLHPTAPAVAIIVRRMLPSVRAALSSDGGARSRSSSRR